MENVNILIGRFQPFTLGHLKCCEAIYKDRKLKTVLLVIDTKKTDKRHPFLTDMLWSSFQKLKSKYVADVIRVKDADIVKNAPLVREHGFEPVTWTCGTDRLEAYRKFVKNYGEQAELVPNFEVFEIPRTDSDISATDVRNAIKNGDQNEFERMTPKEFHPLYYKLKKAMEEVNERFQDSDDSDLSE